MIAPTVTPVERWKDLAVKFGIDGLAGFVAGAIGLGVLTFRGGMRLITITSGRQGFATENGAIAGDFTVEGTLFLVLAGAVLGMVLALLIGLVREGLPGQIWLGILVFAPLLARLLIINPDNIDFIRFAPAWVAIAAFTLGVAVYLALVAFLVNRLENNWRLPKPLLIAGGAVAASFLLLAFSGDFGNPFTLIGIAVVGALVVGRWSQSSWYGPLAKVLIWVVTIFGLVSWIQAVARIL